MKILIISNVYFPVLNPRAIRWRSIAEYWATQGHSVDVVTSWRPGLSQTEKRNGVSIHRTGKTVFQSVRVGLLTMFERTSVQNMGTRITFIRQLAGKMIRLIKSISDYTWKKIHWPDCECLWYFPALKKARSLVAEIDYDAIISVSTPFTSHLIGLRIHSLIPSAQWLVDNGDPFSFLTLQPQNNYKLFNRLNFSIEKKVFSQADHVTVTSQGTLEKYCFFFSECSGKITVIPPLVSFSRNDIYKKPFFKNTDKIKLLYIGNFYRSVRTPAFLLKVFGMLMATPLKDRLELHIMGSVKDVMDYFEPYNNLLSEGKIILYGWVEHRQALDAMFDADVLVNVGNKTSYQIPSKLPDFLATGKPVLNFATIKDDSSALFFENYPSFLNVFADDVTAESHDFRTFVDFLNNLPEVLDINTIEKIIQPYTTETIAHDYMLRITRP